MQYRVTGYAKSNGAKVTLEFEAQSKAEAERKAVKQNMEVIRVELATEAEARESTGQSTASRPVSSGGAYTSRGGGSGILGKLVTLLVLAGIAAAVWYFWPQISAMVFKK